MPNAETVYALSTSWLLPEWACSSAWLERTPDKREVGSSSLPRPTISGRCLLTLFSSSGTGNGGVAQLGERLLCKQEVIGSIPFTSTNSPEFMEISSKNLVVDRRRLRHSLGNTDLSVL